MTRERVEGVLGETVLYLQYIRVVATQMMSVIVMGSAGLCTHGQPTSIHHSLIFRADYKM